MLLKNNLEVLSLDNSRGLIGVTRRANCSEFAIRESLAAWNFLFRFSFATLAARMRGLRLRQRPARRPNPDRTSRPGISPASKTRWRRPLPD
jgi:hypothetical protein